LPHAARQIIETGLRFEETVESLDHHLLRAAIVDSAGEAQAKVARGRRAAA